MIATYLYMHTGRWCGIDSDGVVHVNYLFPLALVTRGVLSIGFCDLLRVVLADGSIAAFFPRLLLGAGDVLPSFLATSSSTTPVPSSVNPARRSPIRDVSIAPVFPGFAGRGFGIVRGTAVPSRADAGPAILRGLFCGDPPSAKSSPASSSGW